MISDEEVEAAVNHHLGLPSVTHDHIEIVFGEAHNHILLSMAVIGIHLFGILVLFWCLKRQDSLPDWAPRPSAALRQRPSALRGSNSAARLLLCCTVAGLLVFGLFQYMQRLHLAHTRRGAN